MGADAVELDVRRSADGHLVVHHDPRLADGRNIVGTTRRELPDDLPSLDAALDACLGMWVNVEIKNDPNEPDFDPSDSVAFEVAAALVGRGDPHRYLVSSFRRETIDALRRATELVPTAWLTIGIPEPDTAAVLDSLVADGHCALHPWVATLSREVIDECHERGLGVNTWTCDDPQRMAELVSWGIDGICTNVPDVAIDVLRAR